MIHARAAFGPPISRTDGVCTDNVEQTQNWKSGNRSQVEAASCRFVGARTRMLGDPNAAGCRVYVGRERLRNPKKRFRGHLTAKHRLL